MPRDESRAERCARIERTVRKARPGPWRAEPETRYPNFPSLLITAADGTVIGDWEAEELDDNRVDRPDVQLACHASVDLLWCVDMLARADASEIPLRPTDAQRQRLVEIRTRLARSGTRYWGHYYLIEDSPSGSIVFTIGADKRQMEWRPMDSEVATFRTDSDRDPHVQLMEIAAPELEWLTRELVAAQYPGARPQHMSARAALFGRGRPR